MRIQLENGNPADVADLIADFGMRLNTLDELAQQLLGPRPQDIDPKARILADSIMYLHDDWEDLMEGVNDWEDRQEGLRDLGVA